MATTARASRLSSLKVTQLKHLASLTGLGQTGTKAELEASLQQHITSWQPRDDTSKIVSVDMGLRNLAFCAMDVPPTASSPQPPSILLSPSCTSLPKPAATPLKITTWRRADLLSSLTTTSTSSSNPGPFHPSTLSALAYDVSMTSLLASPMPSTILIERQRFRTRGFGGGGGGAVAEWTLRVNMFEAMLWACLTTLRRRPSGREDGTGWDGRVQAMSPDRVVAFLTAVVAGEDDGEVVVVRRVGKDGQIGARKRGGGRRGSGGTEDEIVGDGPDHGKRTGRSTLEKRDRVAIVRKWTEAGDLEECFGGVRLSFEGQAAETADAFRSRKARAADGGKLDDLADCLLQAVAWVKWEDSCNAIKQWLNGHITSERSEDETGADMRSV